MPPAVSPAPRSAPAAGSAQAARSSPGRRVLAATVVGTTVEFYDFYLYATAAVAVFPALFFAGEQQGALLASLATFAAAFVARPIGAVLFGHLGDRLGRKASLLLSLALMGAATVLIGLLPPAAQIGAWAPALLAVLRFCQGLGLSGEWTGATLLATEHAPPGRRGRAAAWPQLGAPLGFGLANGACLLLLAVLGDDASGPFMTWGWRVPFLASLVMVFVGWWVRAGVAEAPAFAALRASGSAAKRPVLEVLRTGWRGVLLGAGSMLSMYVLFYLVIAWALSHGLRPTAAGGLGLGYGQLVGAQLLGVPLFAAAVLLAGYLADRWGAAPALATVAAAVGLFGASFAWWFAAAAAQAGGASGGVPAALQLFLLAGMTLMGLSSGTASALMPWLFPTRLRFSGAGVASNLAALLGAAATPYLAVWLDSRWGVAAVGLYLAAAAAITLVCALLVRRGAARMDEAETGAADVSLGPGAPGNP